MAPDPHPLKHLSSVSAEGLRARAAIWREQALHDPDDAVKSLLLAAAADIEAADATFATLAAADDGTLADDRHAAAAIVGRTRLACAPAALRRAAARLRAQGLPDDSGSSAAHLESAAERIAADAAALAELRRAASDGSFDPERIRALAAAARPESFVPTHESPRPRM